MILSDEGLLIDPEKVKTICNFDRPTNVTEVRSFLGMTNYCSRFIKGHAELTEPLRKLTIKTEKEFNWNQRCENAFITLKEALSSTQNLAFFNPKLKTELIVDASPVGIGAILCQLADDGQHRIIAYASKALTPTEQRYSQTEREALAIVWGAEQFSVFLIGARFTVWMDHKALVPMFNNPAANLSIRMERWMMRKQTFDMDVQYLPGEWNTADYFSRHPGKSGGIEDSKLSRIAERYVNFTTVAATDVIPAKEVEKELEKDETLKLVKLAIGDGRWHKIPKETRKQFEPIQQELTVTKDGIVVRKPHRDARNAPEKNNRAST